MYDWCWTLSPKDSNQDKKQLTRWLGPSSDVSGELCYALLTAKAQVIIRSSVSPLRKEEVDAEDIKEMKRQFTAELNERLEGKRNGSGHSETFDTMDYARYSIPIEDSSPSFTEYEDDEEEDFKLDDHNEESD